MGELTWHVPQRDSRKHLTYPVLNTPRLTGANVAGGSCRTLSECCLCTMLYHWFFFKSLRVRSVSCIFRDSLDCPSSRRGCVFSKK
jgi:hypothetical protein